MIAGAVGRTSRAIATTLYLSKGMIRAHPRSIMRKLDAANRALRGGLKLLVCRAGNPPRASRKTYRQLMQATRSWRAWRSCVTAGAKCARVATKNESLSSICNAEPHFVLHSTTRNSRPLKEVVECPTQTEP
jgi:hypothetical protein